MLMLRPLRRFRDRLASGVHTDMRSLLYVLRAHTRDFVGADAEDAAQLLVSV
jgi:hypothetical protein